MGISKKRHLKFWPFFFFRIWFEMNISTMLSEKVSCIVHFFFLLPVIAKKSVFQIPKILRIESFSKFFIDCILTLCQSVKVYTFSTCILTTLIINLEEFKYDTIIYSYYWSYKNKLKICKIIALRFSSSCLCYFTCIDASNKLKHYKV